MHIQNQSGSNNIQIGYVSNGGVGIQKNIYLPNPVLLKTQANTAIGSFFVYGGLAVFLAAIISTYLSLFFSLVLLSVLIWGFTYFSYSRMRLFEVEKDKYIYHNRQFKEKTIMFSELKKEPKRISAYCIWLQPKDKLGFLALFSEDVSDDFIRIYRSWEGDAPASPSE